MLNSENNKKFTKDPKYLKYESASRTNLRLVTFIFRDILSLLISIKLKIYWNKYSVKNIFVNINLNFLNI